MKIEYSMFDINCYVAQRS